MLVFCNHVIAIAVSTYNRTSGTRDLHHIRKGAMTLLFKRGDTEIMKNYRSIDYFVV